MYFVEYVFKFQDDMSSNEELENEESEVRKMWNIGSGVGDYSK